MVIHILHLIGAFIKSFDLCVSLANGMRLIFPRRVACMDFLVRALALRDNLITPVSRKLIQSYVNNSREHNGNFGSDRWSNDGLELVKAYTKIGKLLALNQITGSTCYVITHTCSTSVSEVEE